MPVLLEGKDALVRSQTGSGKTLAYAVPIIEHLQRIRPKLTRKDGLKALIVLPTRELAIQTYEWFVKLVKVRFFLVYSASNEVRNFYCTFCAALHVVSTRITDRWGKTKIRESSSAKRYHNSYWNPRSSSGSRQEYQKRLICWLAVSDHRRSRSVTRIGLRKTYYKVNSCLVVMIILVFRFYLADV